MANEIAKILLNEWTNSYPNLPNGDTMGTSNMVFRGRKGFDPSPCK